MVSFSKIITNLCFSGQYTTKKEGKFKHIDQYWLLLMPHGEIC